MFYHNIRLVEGRADTVCVCVHNLLMHEDRQKEGRWSPKIKVKMQ